MYQRISDTRRQGLRELEEQPRPLSREERYDVIEQIAKSLSRRRTFQELRLPSPGGDTDTEINFLQLVRGLQ